MNYVTKMFIFVVNERSEKKVVQHVLASTGIRYGIASAKVDAYCAKHYGTFDPPTVTASFPHLEEFAGDGVMDLNPDKVVIG